MPKATSCWLAPGRMNRYDWGFLVSHRGFLDRRRRFVAPSRSEGSFAATMHKGYQLSLLQTGQGRGFLFGKGVLEKYLEQHQTTAIPRQEAILAAIGNWIAALRSTEATEASLETAFVTQVFCGILGYTLHPSPAGVTATFYAKPSSRITRIKGTPDAVLGEFTDSQCEFVGAAELKSPGTNLDLPQSGHDYKSPVEQGFEYGKRILGVRWVLVSDMRLIRLYSIESEDEYEEVDLAACIDKNSNPTAEFRKLILLLHHDYLVAGRGDSQVSLLYAKSAERQSEIRDSFYELFYQIRAHLFDAIGKSCESIEPRPTREQLLEATQRLLARLLFIYYCEDHPQQLINKGTIESVIDAASKLPGASHTRIYDYLKYFFREIDAGSPPASGLDVPGYNGELFKNHPIIDRISLPDSLNKRRYKARERNGERIVEGVWGLHIYDFWSELNEHLLGHVFQESLSDLKDVGLASEPVLAEKMRERRRHGIFYTDRILAEFLCDHAFQDLLGEIAPLSGDDDEQLLAALQNRLERLRRIRAIDLACGSGAFLTSLYRDLLQEFYRLQRSIASIGKTSDVDLFSAIPVVEQLKELPHCLFGVDLLPQAAEIAKLAIWLRSARKGEKVLDLSKNILAANSLDVPSTFEHLGVNPGTFDLVVGNPPWGGEMEPEIVHRALSFFGLAEDGTWDSWELFVLLGIRALREGGRLALVLPDSFLYPQKARLRQLLFDETNVEMVHNLGPDWFGPGVRMGTVAIQARRGGADRNAAICAMILAGDLRARAIRGETPLRQIESQRSRLIPVARVLDSTDRELEVFRGEEDDRIIAQLTGNSAPLSGKTGGFCERARGEEINKAGLIWICPSCLNPTTPGAIDKGSHKNKTCETCGNLLTPATVDTELMICDTRSREGHFARFIDGDDVNRRYVRVIPHKWIRADVAGWSYKNAGVYAGPKILIRQAGVGICATLDDTNARCPQSVYIYRLRPERRQSGYRHEYVLAALLSRTMAYFVFKRFAEIDVAKAHAKLTHERLETLPIPVCDFGVDSQRAAHDEIVNDVRLLLDGIAELGGEEDRRVEQNLRVLWGISGADGAYINGEFHDLPDGQALRDLFPHGRPRPQTPTHIE